MIDRLNQDQERLFCSFCLDNVVADDHGVCEIAGFTRSMGAGLQFQCAC